MTTNSIATNVAAAMITGLVATAHASGRAGERLFEHLDNLETVPPVLWKLCARLESVERVLSSLAERLALRLGVDMAADVLEPMIDGACCVSAAQ
jgi:hypothetical protein